MIYLKLAWSYFKIGLFGFGGGYAMLSLIERAIVGNGWLSPAGFTDIVAISQMTPGPIGINSATYIGYVVCGGHTMDGTGVDTWANVLMGILGAIMCTAVVTIPSFLLVIGASKYIDRHRDSNFIKGMLGGLKPVVPGLIAAAALLLMNGENFGTETRDVVVSILICVATFLGARLTDVHPIFLICIAAVAGLFLF